MSAPPAPKQGVAVAGCNYVAQDEIWKAHISQEVVAAKKWPQNWNFLTTSYPDLVKDDFPSLTQEKVKIPSPIQVKPPTPLEERVTVHPSTEPVPHTTSKMIGWRSSVDKLKLEKYGGYAKPKGSLLKKLNWPAEAAI